MASVRRSAAGGWAFALAAGCTPDPEPLEAELTWSEWAGNEALVAWRGPAGTAWVEVGEDALDRRVGARRTDGDVAIPLLGLAPGRTYTWRAVVEDARGRRAVSPRRTLETPAPPPIGATLRTSSAGAQMADAHALLTWFVQGGPSWAVVVDGDGEPVWWVARDAATRVLRARSDDEGIFVATNDATVEDESQGQVWRYGLDGRAPEVTAAPGLHHEFLVDGERLLFLAHRRGLEGLPDWIGDELREVALGEDDPAASAPVFTYADDYPVAPWAPCPHTRRASYIPGFHEWTHSNSLIPAADGDGWWIVSRFLDALVRVSGDGRFLGQVGGRDATWATVGPAFLHAHASHAAGDRLYVYDNGRDHDPPDPPSRLLELRLDEVARTATVVRERPAPSGAHTKILGDVAPLEDGHWLVTGGSDGGLTELDAEGAVVWEVGFAPEGVLGRVSVLPTFP